MKFVCIMVEYELRIKRLACYARLEVHMLSGGAPRSAHYGYHLSSLHHVAHVYQVLGVVAVACLYSEGMANGDALAITRESACLNHLAIECCIDLSARTVLDISARVMTLATEATDDMGTVKGVMPVFYQVEVKTIHTVAPERVVGFIAYMLSLLSPLPQLLGGVFSLHRDLTSLFLEGENLATQVVTPHINDGVRIYTVAINHQAYKHRV